MVKKFFFPGCLGATLAFCVFGAGCKQIDRDFFLAQEWTIYKAVLEGSIQTYRIEAGKPDSLTRDISLDSIFDFPDPGLKAVFKDNGEYQLSAFPDRVLNLVLADTAGHWDLSGDSLILDGTISGAKSVFRLDDYGSRRAEMVKINREEIIIEPSFIRQVHDRVLTLYLRAEPKSEN
jgi:hypothetical protein